MKKAVGFFMATVMAASMVLTGCSGKQPSSQPSAPAAETETEPAADRYGEADGAIGEVDEQRKTTANSDERYDSVVFAIASDPTDLNPWNKMTGSKFSIYELIYEQLFDWIGGEYVPSLAESYEVVDDLHYEVKLNENIHDSEGNIITVDDVIACYDRYVTGGYAVRFDSFDKVEKVDDSTLLFTWKTPITGIGELEHIFCNVQIYSQKAWEEHNFATEPVGTGPYVLKSFTSGSSVILEANDDYWRPADKMVPWHAQNVQNIEFQVVSESSQNMIGLQTGVIDFSANISNDSLSSFQPGGEYSEDYMVYTIAGTNARYLAMNCTEGKITADPNFRLACFYAIDNEAVAAAVGMATPAKAFGSAQNPDYVKAWEDEKTYFNTCDLELAKEYLDKTAYNGETLILMGENSEIYKNSMVMIQSQLLQIGVNVEIQALDPTLAMENATKPDAYDMMTGNMGGNPLIAGANRLLNNAEYGNGCAAAFVKDDKLQELYETAANVNTWNDETMTELFHYITENAYYLDMYGTDANIVCTKDIAEVYVMNSSRVMPNACTYYLD